MKYKKLIQDIVPGIMFWAASPAVLAQNDKPNIIFIIADQ